MCPPSYDFNICGNSGFTCMATWPDVYETGVAVQYWGDVPQCNTSAPACSDFYGKPRCCTQDCHVLGVGPPQMALKQPQNPQSGGVTVSYYGVPTR